MKKVIITIVCLAFVATAQAQISIIPEVGINFTTIRAKSESGNTTTTLTGKMEPGFHAGGLVAIPIMAHLSIQPGIYYNYSRTRFDLASMGTANLKATMSLQSLYVPAYLMFYSGHQNGLFAGLGPYASFYLSGKKDSDLSFNGNSSVASSEKVKFGDDASDDLKSIDFGGSLTVGYQLSSGISLRTYFNLGISNLQPKGDSDHKIDSKVFGINIGYRF